MITLAAPISESPFYWAYPVAMAMLAVGVLVTFCRLLRGPTLPDRVVALDQIGYFAVGIIAVWAIMTEEAVLLSVAIVMALILFLGTAAFSLFIERRARP